MGIQPEVSIIIPTYNRSKLLRKTLFSIQSQTLQNWECIVVDDGGHDGTDLLMAKLAKKDSRFIYFKRPKSCPKGASACRNFGFTKSSGKYIQWLDDDDLLSINKLEVQITELSRCSSTNSYATCGWDLYWEGKSLELKNPFGDLRKVPKEDFYEILAKKQSFVPLLTYLTPRELCLKAGEWHTGLSLNDDAEYFNRVLVNSKELLNVQNCYVLYREHDLGRLSRKRSEKHIRSFFSSQQLMHEVLKEDNIRVKKYFRWKLLKWFLTYNQSHFYIMKEYSSLLKEYGIDCRKRYYYILKHKLYKEVYPLFKKIKLNTF